MVNNIHILLLLRLLCNISKLGLKKKLENPQFNDYYFLLLHVVRFNNYITKMKMHNFFRVYITLCHVNLLIQVFYKNQNRNRFFNQIIY
jgi:hypothetical protein